MAITNGHMWPTIKLKDCIVQLNTGLNPRDNFTLGTGEIKYITAKNLTDTGMIDFSTCDYVDSQAKEIIHRRSDIQVGDILFGSRAPIGHCHLIKDEPNYFDVGESIFCIRVNKDVIAPEYLCLYLSSNYFIEMASKRVTGSIIKEIRIGDLLDTDVVLPPENIQKQIARCIGEIDNKTILNKAICSDLEGMARLLYDYWFVQFDFPDGSGNPYKSSGGKMVWNEELKREIPEGWEVKHASDLTSVKTGKEDANFATINGSYAYFTCGQDILKCDVPAFEGRAVLLAGNGDFNVKHYTGSFNAYQRTYVLIPDDSKYYALLYIATKETVARFTRGSAGSIVKFITLGDVNGITLLDPKNDTMLEKFNLILDKIEQIQLENQQLASLRDFLLPMLMNGQVKISS